MLKLLKEKKFWINTGLALASMILLVFIIFQSFNFYTRHGKSVEVPDVSGLPEKEAKKVLAAKGLVFVLKDSISEIKEKELQNVQVGAVVYQNPVKGESVKPGRKIYISLRAGAAVMVTMPNLKDLPFANALEMLSDYGLKLGKKIEKPGPPPVMEQRYQGNIIKPGTMIPKGSKIDLVIGKGDSDVKVAVPNLIGLTRKRAIEVLSNASLDIGAEIPSPGEDEGDDWVVTRQNPAPTAEPSVGEGSPVDLFYRNN